jgi:dTDP-4-dehydrorhamnose 3,5-epimerase-like enzyme
MKIQVIDLECIKTKDVRDGHQNGIFIPVWRDWDKIYDKEPKMVYVTTCFRGELKGPHLHKYRWSYLTVLKGKVVFIVKVDDEFEEFVVSHEKPQTIVIPAGVPQAHFNIGDEDAIVMNLCNPAWHPENQDNYTADYGDYDFKKWGYCSKKMA